MSSVRQIAKELGISVATVSRAINQNDGVSEQTRRRVLLAAEKSGYSPSIGKKPTNVIGLVYPDEPVKSDLGDFEAALLSGILKGVYEKHHDLIFISASRDKHPDETYRQFFHRKGVKSVIIRSLGETELVKKVTAEQFPALLIADRSDDPQVSYIDSISYGSSVQAVEHLISLGHRRIALAMHNISDTDHSDRERGFRDAHTTAGIAIDEDLVVRSEANTMGGEQMLSDLLSKKNPPTAIFFTNPMSTIGALYKCMRLGIKVPSELSIVGVDDSNTRYQTFPRYTAVCQDAIALGVEAALWIIRTSMPGASKELEVFRETRPTAFEVLETTARPAPVPRRLDQHGKLVESV